MGRNLRCVALGCALALVAGFAAAEVFTVTLTNGSVLETRYRPVLDDDETKAYLLTDMGNWIALDRDSIVTVESEFERRGFGLVINTTTISLGMAPNDRVAGEEAAGEISDTRALLNYLQAQDSARGNYSVEQFVDTEQSSGIPMGFANQTTPPIGGIDDN